jgi:hypothetical protein
VQHEALLQQERGVDLGGGFGSDGRGGHEAV